MEGGLINPLALIRTGAAKGVTSADLAGGAHTSFSGGNLSLRLGFYAARKAGRVVCFLD